MPTLSKKEVALFSAIPDNNIKDVFALLRDGVNPNCHNVDGWSPSLEAAGCGRPIILIMLFEAGALPVSGFPDGPSMYEVASFAGHKSTESIIQARQEQEEFPEWYPLIVAQTLYQLEESGMKEEMRLLDESLSDKTRKAMAELIRK